MALHIPISLRPTESSNLGTVDPRSTPTTGPSSLATILVADLAANKCPLMDQVRFIFHVAVYELVCSVVGKMIIFGEIGGTWSSCKDTRENKVHAGEMG